MPREEYLFRKKGLNNQSLYVFAMLLSGLTRSTIAANRAGVMLTIVAIRDE